MQNFGFIKPIQTPEDWVFGSGKITGDVLQPSMQWDEFIPTEERQDLHGVEPYACVSFGTLNVVETLLKRQYGDTNNFSDRYLAKISGTEYQNGNSPQTVAEYLRKLGDVLEYEWPFTPEIRSFAEYYKLPPASLAHVAANFTREYRFFHDYVPSNPAAMMDALKYSPLGVSVNAWFFDSTGMAVKMGPDNHWCMVYGFVPNQYWKCFDSYDNTHKKIAWETPFEVVKSYQVSRAALTDRQTIAELIRDKIRLIKLLLGL